jgi:DNA-binding MarR family transcriptional regulator
VLEECELPQSLLSPLVDAACHGRQYTKVPGGVDPWWEHQKEKQPALAVKPPKKLSQLQRRLLRSLGDYGDCGAPLACRRKGHDRSQAAVFSRMLRRLEPRNLVVVTRTPAGRAERVTLTETGQAAARNG